MSQHEYVSMSDGPGKLDKAIEKLHGEGRRILGFWRSSGWWMFKLMARP